MIACRFFPDENTKILPQSVWHVYLINQNKLYNASNQIANDFIDYQLLNVD